MTDCEKCGMRDDDWFLCRKMDCQPKIAENKDAFIASLRDANKALTAEKARLEDDLDEANRPVWPKWADEIRKCLEGYGVDPGDEWDLPEQFEIWIAGVVENETARAEAAEAENARLKALPLKDERHLTLDEQKTFDVALRNSGTVRQVLPLKDEVERVLNESRRHVSENLIRMYGHDGFGEIRRIDALLSRLRAGEQEGWRSQAADDVLAERRRQVEAEGWTPEHDDGHSNGELAAAASCYAYSNASVRKLVPSRWAEGRSMDDDDIPVGRTEVPANWPDWDGDWWKPSDPRRNLIKAGALIIAEIERLDRRPAAPSEHGGGHD